MSDLLVPLPTGEQLPSWLVRPDGRPRPGIVVVHDASGPIPFYRTVATLIASTGYVALLPDLYFRQGPLSEQTAEAEMDRLSRLDKRQSVSDLLSTVTWLKAQPEVDGVRSGVVGFSLGATLALDMTAERSDLAVAAFYPFPMGQIPPDENSPPAPLSVVAGMTGPIVAFWGDHDEVVPMEDVRRLAAECEAHRVSFRYTVYPGVGHSFIRLSELEAGHEASMAALDAWAKALHFFEVSLSGQAF